MEEFITILRKNYYKEPFDMSDENLLAKLLIETNRSFKLLNIPKNTQQKEEIILKDYTVIVSHEDNIEKYYKSTEKVKFLGVTNLKYTNKAQFQLLANNRKDIIDYIHSIIENVSLITII